MKTALLVRLAFAAIGAAIVGAVAAVATADDSISGGEVGIGVEIAPITEPGVLAMSISADSAMLTEQGSDPTVRRFAGVLPTVTVTDTRDPASIPPGAGWYVLGSASDFTGAVGQASIGADHLGWTPRLIDGGASGTVAEGDQVDTVLEEGPDAVGLVDQELLALTTDSGAIRSEGAWSATADLLLETEPTVTAGGYSSTLTLSLFE